ncbi:MAG: GNAT family N-acetyltransferase [Bacillaceae bacterium]|nr:GNAT family N-acetyltransferase [Bacillaceae bacterium]
MSTIRFARVMDARTLSELALRSKAYWGYGNDFLEKCRYSLTITPQIIVSQLIFVYDDYQIKGFYGINTDDLELTYFFIEPSYIGKGIGKQLFQHALNTAKQLGLPHLVIHSDPYAESFYQKMGARRIGEVPSEVQHDRLLPLLKIDVD